MQPTNSDAEHLVFFETSGNQAYIYATNKLRENIGASELTYRAGTQWVLEAVGFCDAPTGNPKKFREWLKKHHDIDGVEIVIATSGKALLVVPDRETGERIIATVTRRAAIEAPGLSVTGAIVALQGRERTVVNGAMHEVHKRFNANRDRMPVPAQRFQMLPFCEPCATSGLPASEGRRRQGELRAYAVPTLKKLDAADKWFERIRSVFKQGEDRLFITDNIDQLEKKFEDLDWLGLVFSDGNGLGQIVMKFDEWLKQLEREDGKPHDYLDTFRAFSLELDEATENAFYAACKWLADDGVSIDDKRDRKRLPVVPLLLGGDDVTVMLDGRYALPFTRKFLEAFEEETGKTQAPTLSRIAGKALGAPRLSAGAGVAIVKPHFPVHSSHALATALLKSAKQTKREVLNSKSEPYPCSALDFHVLFDAAFAGLDDIRERRRKGPDGERLWGGPYVVTPMEDLKAATGTAWAERHHVERLLEQVGALNDHDEDDRSRLPASQMHSLREAMSQGRGAVMQRMNEMHGLDLKAFRESDGSPFFEDGNDHVATRFLDALSSCGFWSGLVKREAGREDA